jgi:hypothetical protein
VGLFASTSWTRVRSGAITLTDDTDYTVRVSNDNGGYRTQIIQARIIIVQSNPTKITTTQSQIDMGTAEDQASTSYTQLTNNKIYYHDSSKFNPTVQNAYLEAVMRGGQPTIEQQINITNTSVTGPSCAAYPTDNSLGLIRWDANKYHGATVYFEAIIRGTGIGSSPTFYAALYNSSGSVVSGSAVSVFANSSFVRLRSSAITLTDDTDYTVRIYDDCGTGNRTVIQAARLIVIQSNTTKITDSRTQVEIGNYQTAFTNTSATELTNYKIYKYDKDQFTPTPESSGDVTFNATLKTDNSLDTVYAELYNLTNSTVVATASHTGNTNWTLASTANVDGDADWDQANDDEYIVRVYCADGEANGCSGNISNAKVILDQSDANGITNLELIHNQVNTLKTDADSTYTSQSFMNRFNPNNEATQAQFMAGDFVYYYEATLKTSAGTGYARLYNNTTGAITGGEVSTTSTSYSRQRSGDITANVPKQPTTTSATDMETQIKNAATDTTSVSVSALIIDVNSLSTTGSSSYVELYNLTDGTSVSNSPVTTSNTSWTRVRSGSFTLTTGKEYVIRLKATSIIGAKLILDQVDPTNGISKTQITLNVVSANATDADTGYTSQSRFMYYTPANFVSVYKEAYFDTTIKTSAGTGYAQLYGGSAITGSEVTTTSTSFVRARSGNIFANLPTSATQMDTQVKNSASNTTTVTTSSLILDISNVLSQGTRDSASNLYHADITGAAWGSESECKFGKCLYFDGVNDYAFTGDANALDYGTGSFSVSLWFKSPIRTAGTGVMVGKFHTTGSDGGYKIYMDSDGDVLAGIDDDSTSFPEDSVTTTGANYDDNKWHNLVFVKNGTSSISLYIDGVLIGTDASLSATGTLTNGDRIYLGIDGDGASNPYKGYLDDIKIFPDTRALNEMNADKINSSDDGSSAAFGEEDQSNLTAALAAYWKMDEKTANTCTGGANDSCDSSGFVNDAAWSGNTAYTLGKFGGGIDVDGTSDMASFSTINGMPYSPGNWTKRIKVTFDNSASSENLTNFPVLVKLNSSRISYADTQNAGQDIRFTDSDGTTLLSYQIEKWDEAGDSYVWVKVPQIDLGSTTDFVYMYYGNSSAADAQTATAVWDSNFKGVWHLPDGSSLSLVDSTSNAKNGSLNGSITASSGQIDGAGLFDGTSGFINGSPLSPSALTTFTVSAWVKVDGLQTEAASILSDIYSTRVNYALRFDLNTRNIKGGSYDGTWRDTPTVTLSDGVWTYVAFSYDGATLKLYTNNNDALTTNVVFTPQSNNLGYRIGRRWDNANYVKGNIDEVRVSGTARSASWVKAEYKTGTDTLNTYATAESISNNLENSAANMTISAWVKADTLGAANRVIIARNNSSAYSWAIYNDSANPGKLKFTSDGNNTSGISNTTLATGNWYHVAMSVDRLKTRLFINGTLDQEVASNGSIPSTGDISIGADPDGTDGWDGILDEVRIYGRSLSDKEVKDLYNFAPGPVGYWNLDENTGTTANDSSGNANTGTVSDSTSWHTGRFGAGLDMDGSTDMVSVADAGSLDLEQMTLSAWAKFDSLNSQIILEKGATASQFSNYYLWYSGSGGACGSNVLCVGFRAGSGTWQDHDFAWTPTLNQWYHLTGTYDRSRIKLYINGKLVLDEAETLSPLTGTEPLRMGRSIVDGGRYFSGNLDEVKIYNYARTPSQVVMDMNGGHPIGGSPIGSQLARLKLDEMNGTTANDELGSYSATLTNTPTWTTSGKFNSAIDFDNSANGNRHLLFANDAFDGQTEGSVSLWFKPDDTGDDEQTLFAVADGTATTNAIEIMYKRSTDTIKIWTGGCDTGLDIEATATVPGNQTDWHHVVYTVNGSGNTIYIDGLARTATYATGSSARTCWFDDVDEGTSYYSVACDYWAANQCLNSELYDGIIDDIQIYSDALTATEVKVLYGGNFATNFGVGQDEKDTVQGGSGSDPVGVWNFEERTGTTTADTSGNQNTLSLNNFTGQSWSSGKYGSALEFDGSNQFLSRADDSDFDFAAANSFSVEAWFKRTGSTGSYHTIVAKADNTNGGYKLYMNTDGTLTFGIDDDTVFTPDDSTVTSNSYIDGKWHHVVGVKSATSSIKIYVDGVLQATDASIAATGTLANSGQLYVGIESDGASSPWRGYIDQVKIYNYALSQEQISYDFNRGEPIAWWKMDECTDTTLNDSGSGGNNGAITIGGTGTYTSAGNCTSGTAAHAWYGGATGKYNGSLGFDGTDDYVTVTDANILDLNATSFSIFTWVKITALPTSGNFMSILEKYNNGTGDGWDFRLYNNSGTQQLDFTYYAPNSVSRTTSYINTLSTGSWISLGFIHNATADTDTLYVDGKQVAQDTGRTNDITASTKNLTIGNFSGISRYFNGLIDEVRIYNYALSPAQILKVMNNNTTVRFGPDN